VCDDEEDPSISAAGLLTRLNSAMSIAEEQRATANVARRDQLSRSSNPGFPFHPFRLFDAMQ
jgi:hypothetical protein